MGDRDEIELALEVLDRRTRAGRRTRAWALAAVICFAIMAVTLLIVDFPCIGCAAAPAAQESAAACPGGMVCTPAPTPRSSDGSGSMIVLALSALGSFVSALATVSSVILGWRKDRRESDEFRQRLAELEARRS